MTALAARPTRATLDLEALSHNVRLLETLAQGSALWPVMKADAYGHGAVLVGRHLLGLGYRTFCVADFGEAVALREAGLDAKFITLSATLPDHAEALVACGCEPLLATLELAEALAREGSRRERVVSVHLAVDTGMGRIGVAPQEVPAFLARCRDWPFLRVRGLMSHFARAAEADQACSREQLARFRPAVAAARAQGVEVIHMANSAALFDLPEARFDAVRPGIALYGLRPAAQLAHTRVAELRPVLEWTTRIVFLEAVPAGRGLSYGHSFRTARDSLIATLPVGYGDGLRLGLSDRMEVLVRGVRCPQVGRITMDMTLVDVTALRGRVAPGDEAVLIGRRGAETLTTDALAATLGTLNYEVVTAIGPRVPRVAANPPPGEPGRPCA
ncbi:MAG: alanine racemase [Candidatus Lambdaproteobacteria bacterium]|nr:alanine racemase [Candidatus Lambdaproteobacteria bacterium]